MKFSVQPLDAKPNRCNSGLLYYCTFSLLQYFGDITHDFLLTGANSSSSSTITKVKQCGGEPSVCMHSEG